MNPGSRRIELAVGPETFHALEYGEHDADLVLCLHGFPDHPPTFSTFANALASRGYRVVVPWLRGYWPSPLAGAVDLASLTQDAAELLIACTGDSKQQFVVGHDWGAAITYTLLASDPECATAACAISVPHPIAFATNALRSPSQLRRSSYMVRFQRRSSDEVVRADDFAKVKELWQKWSPGFELGAGSWDDLRVTLEKSHPRPIDYYRETASSSALAALWGLRSIPITTPVTTIFGARDGCIDASMARGSEQFFDGSFGLEVLEDAGHFLHAEVPDHLASVVDLSLRRHTPA